MPAGELAWDPDSIKRHDKFPGPGRQLETGFICKLWNLAGDWSRLRESTSTVPLEAAVLATGWEVPDSPWRSPSGHMIWTDCPGRHHIARLSGSYDIEFSGKADLQFHRIRRATRLNNTGIQA